MHPSRHAAAREGMGLGRTAQAQDGGTEGPSSQAGAPADAEGGGQQGMLQSGPGGGGAGDQGVAPLPLSALLEADPLRSLGSALDSWRSRLTVGLEAPPPPQVGPRIMRAFLGVSGLL